MKKNITSFLILKLALDIMYVFFVYDIYGYSMAPFSFSILRYITSFLFLLIYLKIFVNIKDSTFSVFMFFLIILAIIPSMTVSSFRQISNINFFYVIFYWTILSLSFFMFDKVKIKLKFKINIKNFNYYFMIFLSIIVFSISFYLNYSLFGLRILFTFDIYTYRAEFSNSDLSPILGYMLLFSNYVFIPFILIYSIQYKKYFYVLVAFISTLLIFSLNGEKTILFILAYAIGIKVLGFSDLTVASFYKKFTLLLITTVIIIMFITSINLWPIGLFYRTFFIPQELAYNYIEFISFNVPLYLRESILRNIFDSPYESLISFLVTDSINNNANTGLIGDAYANFQFIGLIFYPILISLVIKLISISIIDKTNYFKFVIVFTLVWGIVNFSFFTWLLSGGVLLYLVIINLKRE